MDSSEKLQHVGSAMSLEAEGEMGALSPNKGKMAPGNPPACGYAATSSTQAKRNALGITQAVMPGGKSINLLKTMMTTACERNCYYCSFRAGRNYRRTAFKPEEMASAFMKMYRAGMVEGLFLSSGIIRGGRTSQDKIIDAADILRNRFGFRGYIHLKIMPGADDGQIMRTMQLANRASVNLEAPNDSRLAELAPKKMFMSELVNPLKTMDAIRRYQPAESTWNGRWASSSTQFVVGAVKESDVELLSTTAQLLKRTSLSRTYFMAFRPVEGTPFEELPPEDPWRQHRLYQASYLLRDYGYELEDLPFKRDGRLPLDADPKAAWARENLLENPVELNRSHPEKLMRVPGIGPKSMRAILKARRKGKLRELQELRAIGVNPLRPAPYVLLDGKRPTFQLPLI